jgi:elongation factor Ts
MTFTAKDVQSLRQATGAGMMDAKRALEANDGDMEAARQWLREKGLAKAADRAGRENAQGTVALYVDGGAGAIAQLRCETDLAAKSQHLKDLAKDLAVLAATKGVDEAVASKQSALDDLRLVIRENIEIGEVVRVEAGPGQVVDSYLHVQNERGVNGVLVVLQGGTHELAHNVAVHVGFARPQYLAREDVPADVVEKERATLEQISRNEGKPEAALPKIVEGRLGGFFKEICLLEQPYAKDEKLSIAQLLGDAEVVRYAQVTIG